METVIGVAAVGMVIRFSKSICGGLSDVAGQVARHPKTFLEGARRHLLGLRGGSGLLHDHDSVNHYCANGV